MTVGVNKTNKSFTPLKKFDFLYKYIIQLKNLTSQQFKKTMLLFKFYRNRFFNMKF